PFTLILGAIVAVMAYMVDWQNVIADLIRLWGAVTYAWHSFWGNEGGMKKSVEIVINAEKAAAELKGKVEELKNVLTTGGNTLGGGVRAGSKDGANDLRNGVKAGAVDASGLIAKGVKDAAVSAKQLLDDAAQRAVLSFEKANGIMNKKLSETIVKSSITGAEYTYNALTGAVKEN